MDPIERNLRRAVKRHADAREERAEAFREAREAGMSLRAIGRIVGLSHQRVDQIIRGSRL